MRVTSCGKRAKPAILPLIDCSSRIHQSLTCTVYTSATGSQYRWGDVVNVVTDIQNAGNASTERPFNVQWYLSLDELGSEDDLLLRQENGDTFYTESELLAGRDHFGTFGYSRYSLRELSVNLILPESRPDGWTGNRFFIITRSDAGNTVTELNESNNFGEVGLYADLDVVEIRSHEMTVSTIASLVALVNQSTSSSISVDVSRSGKLDAWIDFNQDGDWRDDEQIIAGVDVQDGPNIVEFVVPAGAIRGEANARFRLSLGGAAGPADLASLVASADYLVSILDREDSPNVEIHVVDHSTLANDSGVTFVQSGGVRLLGVPTGHVGSVHLLGASSGIEFIIDVGGQFVMPPRGIEIVGTGDENSLVLVGDGGLLDLTDSRITLINVAHFDLSTHDANAINSAQTVASLSPISKLLVVTVAENDKILFTDVDDWRMSHPVIQTGRFYLTANNSAAGGVTAIEADTPHVWQNFIRFGDVNNDGRVSAGDALRIINELGRRVYSDRDTSKLHDSLMVEQWPGVYFDQNADGRATALDALRVINELALQLVREQAGEGEALVSDYREPELNSNHSVDDLSDPPVLTTTRLLVTEPHANPIIANAALAETMRSEETGDESREPSASAVDHLLSDDSFINQLTGRIG